MSKLNGQNGPHDTSNVTSIDAARERKQQEKPQTPKPSGKGPKALNIPPVTQSLCIVIIAAFCLQNIIPMIFPSLEEDMLVQLLGFIPAEWTGVTAWSGIWSVISPLTYIFIHGGWMHVIVNTVMLVAFGGGVEKTWGYRAMSALFFIGGLGGALAQAMASPDLMAPLIGASGGTSGLFGGFFVQMVYNNPRYQTAQQRWKVLFGFIALWVFVSYVFGFMGMPGSAKDQAIAIAAHIGGLISGLIYALYLLKRRVPRR